MSWKTLERPGYFGKHRDQKYAEYDQRFGVGNWRIAWKVGENIVDLLGVTALYEDAYFQFLGRNPRVLQELIEQASDVYDDQPTNIESGYDYLRQETPRTHLQDVAIRRCVLRFGKSFAGPELIQIRDKAGSHPLSLTLSPGWVPFHLPDLIIQPVIAGWWQIGSVEEFYQSVKVLQVRG
jgi:hypothetical protein